MCVWVGAVVCRDWIPAIGGWVRLESIWQNQSSYQLYYTVLPAISAGLQIQISAAL